MRQLSHLTLYFNITFEEKILRLSLEVYRIEIGKFQGFYRLFCFNPIEKLNLPIGQVGGIQDLKVKTGFISHKENKWSGSSFEATP